VDYLSDKLNLEELYRASPAATEWVVITGAPSSGKSTVLSKLAELGFQCKPELARVIAEENPRLRDDEAIFQKTVTLAKHDLEHSLDQQHLVFLDRGMPDSITYYRKAGIDPNEALKSCLTHKYKKVFIFERLELVSDGVRTENHEESELIHFWLMKDYKSLGYDPVIVKKAPIDNRVKFILQTLGISNNG